MQLTVFASVLLYLAAFSSACLFAYLGEKKNRKTYFLLAILIPTLIAGLRYSTGTDTLTYTALYNEVGGESFNTSLQRITSGSLEPFVVVISFIGNALHLPTSFMFLSFAVITASFLFLSTRLLSEKHAWLIYGMLLFIVFPESLNMMRQLAANSVQVFALAYIFKRQNEHHRTRVISAALLLLFSISLHYSSLLLLPVFVMPFIIKHVRGRTLSLLLCLLNIAFVAAFPFLLDFVVKLGILSPRHYATLMELKGSIINIKFVASAILAAILIVNYLRRRKNTDKQYALLMLLGVAYSAIGFYSGYIGRLAMFFWILIIPYLGKMICQLFEKESHRVLACSVVAISYFLLYFCVLGFNAIVPYDFII